MQPGDVVQYESAYSPDSWIGGVHTVLVTGVSGGSVQIVEANNPGGSGYVSSNSNWSPHHQQDSALLYGVFQAK